MCMYLYENESDFLKDKNSFKEIFLLIRIDMIEYDHVDENNTMVNLFNDFNC